MTDREPLIVHRSVDREGTTYSLPSPTRKRLEDQFGEAVHLSPRVFIAHATAADYEAQEVSMKKQIFILLTGLPEERLEQLGPVRFVDAVTDRGLTSWTPARPG